MLRQQVRECCPSIRFCQPENTRTLRPDIVHAYSINNIYLLNMKNTRNAKSVPLVCVLFLLLFGATGLFAQIDTPGSFDRSADILRETNISYLLDRAHRDSLRYHAARESAVRFAQLRGYPVEGNFKGREYALQGFDDAGQLQYYATHNEFSASVIKTDQLYPGGDAGLNLTGSGRVLGVWEISRPRATHVELNGRVTQTDNSSQSLGDHATHVCGTLIAAGIDPLARGMAFQADLAAYDANNDLSEMATAATQGARVSNHSYGSISGWDYGDDSGQTGWHWWGTTSISQTSDYKFGQYDSKAQSLDNIVFNAPFYLPVRSAGNDRNDFGPAAGAQHWVRNASSVWVSSTTTRPPDGDANGYDCIPTAGNAKNILTVGAVDGWESGTPLATFSSWGPTDDGRIKPDIVAHGVDVYSSISTNNTSYDGLSGTSMASPAVTGSLELLLQHYENVNPGFSIRASALKALAIHTAEQIGGGKEPNYRTGWGLMNTLAAAELISNSLNAGSRDRFVSRDSVSNGGQREYTFYHDGSGSVKATIVWTDPAGPVSSNTLNPSTLRLVNDLDVRLISTSDNTTYFPWRLNPASPASAATKGDNTRDNVEQIFEENLPAGIYTLRVSHKGTLNGGVQFFSYVISGRANLITACTGVISDGSGNNNYRNNLSHSWTINPTNAASVTLNFTAFNTESGYDFVDVYDGLDANAPLLGSFSGSDLPPSLTAGSGKMHLVFKTDFSENDSGWSANYSCSSAQLSATPASLNFSAGGGVSTINISATCAWSIQNVPSWLILSPSSGSANASVNVTCAPNASQQSQSVMLIITACNGLSQTITVTQSGCQPPATPTLSASGPTSLCAGQSVTLNASNVCAGCTVNWSNGQTGTTITVSTAGNYTATLNNSCGTSPASNAIAVTSGAAPSAPTLSASGPTSLCAGESVTLNASNVCSDCTVNWSNGQTGTSISVSVAGNYTAMVNNPCGASPASNIVEIQTIALPGAPLVVASGPASLCPGQTLTLLVTNVCSGCTVNWSNGQTGASIVVSTAGQYSAIYTNSCGGGPSSPGITVTMSPAFVPAVQVNNLCQLAAPTGSGYQWYLNGTIIPGASGQFWSAQASGYYVVTMTNAAGCTGASDPLFAEACVSGTNIQVEKLALRLYPNPTQDRIFLELQTSTPVTAHLDLFAADGRYIGQLFRGMVMRGGQAVEITLPELPAGAYAYRLTTDQGSANGVIVVQQR